MSIESRWTIGAMASKKASESSPVSFQDRLGQGGRGEGAGGDDDAVPVAGGRPATSSRTMVMSGWAASRGHGGREAVAVDGQRAAGRHLWASPQAMMSEPQRRISACSRPTALVSQSSERNELEQTSSARPSVLWASVPRHRAHLVQDDGHAGLGDLPGGLGAGEAAADRRSQARKRMLMKPSITICPASVAVTVELRPQQSSATANSLAPATSRAAAPACACASSARSRPHGRPDGVEGGRGQDQDRGIDQSARTSAPRSNPMVAISAPRAFGGLGQAIGARLHDAGMQIEIVRHHRGADDAKRQIEHRRVVDDLDGRRKAADDAPQSGSAMAICTKKQARSPPAAR
jgi:hypothetical protein